MSATTVGKPLSTSLRREAMLIVLFTLVATVLRFWRFGRLGLTHFDEGIYALAGLWSVTPRGLPGFDPQVISYAPPGFPVLIGLAYAVVGVSDAAALLVAVIAGVATVPVAGWIGRRTFGEGAGAGASAFAALALAHLAFSRKALTDAPFLLAWLVAVGLGGRFLERPNLTRALAFGLAVGAAQNLKYNGWIAGATVVVAALLGLFRPDARRRSALLRTFGLGLLAVVVAGACYWPWYRFVENHEGYAALIRHHRKYMGGLRSWWPFWNAQLAQVVALSGGPIWSLITWQVAWIAAGLVKGIAWLRERSRWEWMGLRLGFLLGAVVFAAIPDLGWWIGLFYVVPLLVDARPARRILGAWWLILSVMTPFYHPYARLWLPLHAAGWLMLAGTVVEAGPWLQSLLIDLAASGGVRTLRLFQAIAMLFILEIARGHWGDRPPRPMRVSRFFEPTDDLRNVVRALGPDAIEPSYLSLGGLVRIRVLGRRPLAYYLTIQGRAEVRLLADDKGLTVLPIAEREWALVDQSQLPLGGQEITSRADVMRHWVLGRVWETHLDPVTLLDINPDAAYMVVAPTAVPLILLAPRDPDLLPPLPTQGRTDTPP